MVCRIKNRHTFKSLPILNSAYFTECRFVIRHITQTDTETETEANFTHAIRAYSHQENARAKGKKIKEHVKKIKEKADFKEIFRFCFRLV